MTLSWQACMLLVGRPVAIKITRAAYVDPHVLVQPEPVILW